MSAKHTPGPWDSPQFSSAPFGVWKGDTQIASCRWTDDKGNAERECVQDEHEARANATLIAAAPDLLEIARLLSLATNEGDDAAQGTHYMATDGRIRCKGSFLDLIEKARAAIAKATGGAS